MPISLEDFKKLASNFATGVTVITFADDSGVHGLTVNAFSSVSLEPPLVLICIDQNARGHDILADCRRFVVNILSDAQEELCVAFATPNLSSSERYAGTRYRLNARNIPIFEHNLAYLECEIINSYAEGDHTVFIARVEGGGRSDGKAPLLYYGSLFHRLAKS